MDRTGTQGGHDHAKEYLNLTFRTRRLRLLWADLLTTSRAIS
jgi:hypothetical protein